MADDRGETLLELVIAILILGICVVAFGTSIAIGIRVSDQHRQQADASAYLHNYAELIDNYVAGGGSNYQACAPADWYTPGRVGLTGLPSGVTASQSAGLTFSDGTWSQCTTDNGVQQLTLTMASARASEQLVMVIRQP